MNKIAIALGSVIGVLFIFGVGMGVEKTFVSVLSYEASKGDEKAKEIMEQFVRCGRSIANKMS